MKNLLVLLIVITFGFVSCSDEISNPTDSDVDDFEAPSAVTDLSVGFTTGNSATLYLTAPGDDAMFGRARTYEVRYSTSIIDSVNYDLATQFISPNQPNAGTVYDTINVTGLLSNTKYYFAVKVADEAANWSLISNIVSATTLLSGNWTIYRTDNSGLLSNEIEAIEFDGGTKYISTLQGVSTFDNSNWNVIYDSSTIPIIIDTIVNGVDTTFYILDFSYANSIAIENSSKVWFGTQSNGVALLEGDSTVFYRSNDSGSITTTSDILISQNKLWVGTLTNGLQSFTLDGSDIWEQYDIPIDSSLPGVGKINCLEVDANNAIWSGLQLSGATVFDNSVFTNYSSNDNFTNQSVWDIYSSGNQIMFGTDDGAFIFENDIWTYHPAVDSGLPDNVIISVVMDNQGIYWFGTRFGLASLNGTAWTVYTTANSSLPDNWISTMNIDMFGNLWIGTKNGLAIFSL